MSARRRKHRPATPGGGRTRAACRRKYTLPQPALLQFAQLYDKATNTLAPRSRIATMNRLLAGHSATLLNDRNVLIAGGESLGGGLDCGATTSTELYDQTTRSFAAPATTAIMNAGRTGAPAISLSNGKA